MSRRWYPEIGLARAEIQYAQNMMADFERSLDGRERISLTEYHSIDRQLQESVLPAMTAAGGYLDSLLSQLEELGPDGELRFRVDDVEPEVIEDFVSCRREMSLTSVQYRHVINLLSDNHIYVVGL